MTALQPASLSYGQGQLLAVTTSSQSFTVQPGTKQMIFTNLGTNPAFVRMTPTAAAATTADACIPPNSQVSYTKFADITSITIIATGAATSVHMIPSEGF